MIFRKDQIYITKPKITIILIFLLPSSGDSVDRCAVDVSKPQNDASDHYEAAGYTNEPAGYTENKGGYGEVTAYGNHAGYRDHVNNFDQSERYGDYQTGYGDNYDGYDRGYFGRYARYGNQGYNKFGGYGDDSYNGNDYYGHGNDLYVQGNHHYGPGNEHYAHGIDQFSHGNEYYGHGTDHYSAVIPQQSPHYNQYPVNHVAHDTSYKEATSVTETAVRKKDYSEYSLQAKL